jgi:hypothetical protein
MTHERRSARPRHLLLTVLLLMAAVGAPLGREADARGVTGPDRMGPAIVEGSGVPGDSTQRWWGVAGAALCGLEIRLVIRAPAIGMNPYAIAAGIAGCSLAALDVFTTQ